MSDIVYVSGHRNPDTDSICSAIAYSHLLNTTHKYNAVAVRLGEVSRETEYVLKRFNVEIPMLLKTVKQKVEDLNYDKVTVFSKELTLKTAWFLLKQQNLKSAPILDDHGQLLGLLSTSNIIEGYMDRWDASILKEIEKEILKSDIGINPNNDGKVIRLAFPELNEERRKEIVKDIRKMAEETKVAVRSIRRDAIDEAKTMQKNSEISEDELKNAEDNIQKLTDKYVEEIDKILQKKENEIMSI